MNAIWFSNISIPTFSLPLISSWYFDSNRSLMYKSILSISGCWCFTKFYNILSFPNPEPPIIKIL